MLKRKINIDQEKALLGEDRFDKPLEIHKFIAERIIKAAKPGRSITRLLDIGCGTGEFIYYMRSLLPGSEFTGIDLSARVLKRAAAKMPDVDFVVADMVKLPKSIKDKRYDFIVMCGVIGFFDDAVGVLKGALPLLKKKGKIFVLGPFNRYPVDVIMKYKLSGDNRVKSGWNIISKETCYRAFRGIKGLKVRFDDFYMPLKLAKKKASPMRSWTMVTEDNHYQLTNGACQLINLSLMIITKG